MKFRYRTVYALMGVLYSILYNIIEHGGELLFFTGLAVVAGAAVCFEKAYREGFRLLPEDYGEDDVNEQNG